MFLARVTGSVIYLAKVTDLTVLIFLTESSIEWATPSHAQVFNSVVASTMASASIRKIKTLGSNVLEFQCVLYWQTMIKT